MLTTKPRILATAAVIAALVMATGTAAANLVAQPTAAAHPAKVALWQPPAIPLAPAGAQHVEDGEST
jgi:hypothetical protein